MKYYLILILALLLMGCTEPAEQQTVHEAPDIVNSELSLATFAGGCFWCMEPPFEKLDGVHSVVSGYTGGSLENPTYKQVASGSTDHTEAVQVLYDPTIITYEELLAVFWRQIDPTDVAGQFVDRGSQYRPGVFYHTEKQRRAAEQSRTELDNSGVFDKPVVAEITAFDRFYRAEEYHQDYYLKSSVRYKFYRANSGRDQFLDAVWGKGNH